MAMNPTEVGDTSWVAALARYHAPGAAPGHTIETEWDESMFAMTRPKLVPAHETHQGADSAAPHQRNAPAYSAHDAGAVDARKPRARRSWIADLFRRDSSEPPRMLRNRRSARFSMPPVVPSDTSERKGAPQYVQQHVVLDERSAPKPNQAVDYGAAHVRDFARSTESGSAGHTQGTETRSNAAPAPSWVQSAYGEQFAYRAEPANGVHSTYGAQPTYEQPTYEQPTYEQPTYEQPTYEQPVYEYPTYEQPTYNAQTPNMNSIPNGTTAYDSFAYGPRGASEADTSTKDPYDAAAQGQHTSVPWVGSSAGMWHAYDTLAPADTFFSANGAEQQDTAQHDALTYDASQHLSQHDAQQNNWQQHESSQQDMSMQYVPEHDASQQYMPQNDAPQPAVSQDDMPQQSLSHPTAQANLPGYADEAAEAPTEAPTTHSLPTSYSLPAFQVPHDTSATSLYANLYDTSTSDMRPAPAIALAKPLHTVPSIPGLDDASAYGAALASPAADGVAWPQHYMRPTDVPVEPSVPVAPAPLPPTPRFPSVSPHIATRHWSMPPAPPPIGAQHDIAPPFLPAHVLSLPEEAGDRTSASAPLPMPRPTSLHGAYRWRAPGSISMRRTSAPLPPIQPPPQTELPPIPDASVVESVPPSVLSHDTPRDAYATPMMAGSVLSTPDAQDASVQTPLTRTPSLSQSWGMVQMPGAFEFSPESKLRRWDSRRSIVRYGSPRLEHPGSAVRHASPRAEKSTWLREQDPGRAGRPTSLLVSARDKVAYGFAV